MRSAQGRPARSPARRSAPRARRLGQARAVLAAAQNAADRRRRTASRPPPGLDAQMQAQAAGRPSTGCVARAALDAARKRVVGAARRHRSSSPPSNYANGDPALMGLSVMLNSQNPDEVTSQMNTVDSLMSRQTTDARRAQGGPRRRWSRRRRRSRRPRRPSPQQRKAAAANLVRKQGLGARPPPRPAPRSPPWSPRGRAAEAPAARARRADLVQLRGAEEAGGADQAADPRAGPQPARAATGDTGGFLLRPVPGYVTSSVRLPAAPDLRLLGPARRHRLPRPVRYAAARGRLAAR